MIDPVAFTVGSIDVRWYGIVIAGAVAIALPWAIERARRRGLNPAHTETVLWLAILGGLIGARAGYVIQNLGYFGTHPLDVVQLTTGGLSIHGMLVGGFIAAWIAARRYGVAFVPLADAAVPPMLLGMILGRLGNFANSELFGPPTNVSWKLFIPVNSRPEGMSEIAYYHPTFLYDSLLNTLVLVALLIYERRMHTPGRLTLWFLAGIALTRFIVEFWRLGDVLPIGLTLAQLVSLLLLAGAGLALLRRSSPT
ncbi:prolipoprotein diacylglyceryl transferase [Candidatus Berkelbacteria bacterium]|nr:prolipoprotein diacylglyceryl transferase [Candidatus Berkelbacteria bacterium]